MRVLVLSPYPEPVVQTLRSAGDTPMVSNERPTLDDLRRIRPGFVVSYGFTRILPPEIVRALPHRIINLHPSYLPHNRGTDANLWSWIDATPKGVTIHRIDEGIDTGPILAQRETPMSGAETLASSYRKLRADLDRLFDENWLAIRDGRLPARPQAGPGSYHRRRDRRPIFEALPAGYDTPVSILRDLAAAIDRARLTPHPQPA